MAAHCSWHSEPGRPAHCGAVSTVYRIPPPERVFTESSAPGSSRRPPGTSPVHAALRGSYDAGDTKEPLAE